MNAINVDLRFSDHSVFVLHRAQYHTSLNKKWTVLGKGGNKFWGP